MAVCDCDSCPADASEVDASMCEGRGEPVLMTYTDDDGCDCCEVMCSPCNRRVERVVEDARCHNELDVTVYSDINFNQCQSYAREAATSIDDYYFSYSTEKNLCRIPSAEASYSMCVDEMRAVDSKNKWAIFVMVPDCTQECTFNEPELVKEKKACGGDRTQYLEKGVSLEDCTLEAFSLGLDRFTYFIKNNKEKCLLHEDNEDCDENSDWVKPNGKKNYQIYEMTDQCRECVAEGKKVQKNARCNKNTNLGQMDKDECAYYADILGLQYFAMKDKEKCY